MEIDGVSLKFGLKGVLTDVYFKSETGCISGLLGRNGSGKSSLLKTIFGTCSKAENSSVRINNQRLPGQSRSPLDMRYLPQSDFIPKHLHVKRAFADFQIEFSKLLYYFPTFDKCYTQRFSSLSGGERRVISLFLILFSDTRFCLLDEPFSQVMPIHLDAIKDIIREAKKSRGVVITDQMYRHVLDLADRVCLLKDGTLYQVDTVDDLMTLGYL